MGKMKRIFVLILSVSMLTCIISCVNTVRINKNNVTTVSVYKGEYKGKRSSDGTVKWTLFSDNSFEGSWKTKKGSYSINLKGRYDKVNDYSIVFSGAGSVSVFGLDIYKTEVSGFGSIEGDNIIGNFVLFVDQNGFWGDLGNFFVRRVE